MRKYILIGQLDLILLYIYQDREKVKLMISPDKKVYSVAHQGSVVLPRTGDLVTKPREVFYKPVGQKLTILFENKSAVEIFIYI